MAVPVRHRLPLTSLAAVHIPQVHQSIMPVAQVISVINVNRDQEFYSSHRSLSIFYL